MNFSAWGIKAVQTRLFAALPAFLCLGKQKGPRHLPFPQHHPPFSYPRHGTHSTSLSSCRPLWPSKLLDGPEPVNPPEPPNRLQIDASPSPHPILPRELPEPPTLHNQRRTPHRPFQIGQEQGIIGFAIGAAAEGMKPVAEIQFADYVFPAFDQIVNEAAKFRYREGATGGNAGHGALYHSQSPEALFAHIPGLQVVIPRSPSQAKGLLLASIFESKNPVVFMEPKVLYRAAVEHVPSEYYTIPLNKAEVIKPGNDVTIISYGQPLYLCSAAIAAAEKNLGASVELIDLRTIYPWDRQTVLDSVNKTGRAIVVHESMVNFGVGAEVAATIQTGAFLRLEAPVQRVAGWSTHTGLTYEKLILPDVTRIYDAIKRTLEY
ncbi:hypothetical protein AN8559.2 [Aspergillus nidulans FGSC A4]|nr:hypothetical protein AN8559.2 [Aspergillus nidulans FGSC A4]|eukprot:XP_681828.1 hypothetical protein AN8559.2 [Aspergillus nidulans FGSC A4]